MENNYKIYNDELIGKIYEFDGEAGTIVTDNNAYMFFKKDIDGDFNSLKKGEVVSFRVNHYPFGDEVVTVAKFVKKSSPSLRK